ncbi:MAG TPA: enoyl-CoA hydratase [Acidimicrobiales bacterium]|nr:enoyl-CoA hydratase [Acidimicrobiales bacterium]
MSLVEIDIHTDEQVAVVTLNRPEARNALSAALVDELNWAWDRVLDVEDIGAVVLTGADPAFCAGMDLAEMAAGAPEVDLAQAVRLEQTDTPVIGAINGACVTGGLEMVLPCDFLVASERAWFADTHAKLGFLPGHTLSVKLAALVGVGMATEMSLTGRKVEAHEAHAAGLVNRVVAHDELLPTAIELASRIAANDRGAIRQMKGVYRRNLELVQAAAIANAHAAYEGFLAGFTGTGASHAA